jgi:hypothetical protein
MSLEEMIYQSAISELPSDCNLVETWIGAFKTSNPSLLKRVGDMLNRNGYFDKKYPYGKDIKHRKNINNLKRVHRGLPI